MKKGDIVKVKIERYAFEGKGIGRIKREPADTEANFVLFVMNSFPGDLVNAKILKIKKSYAEAVVAEIIESSEYREKARCTHFNVCGGCKQQDIRYDIQAAYKEQQVNEIFQRMGGLTGYDSEKIIPSEQIFFYRNKMEFSFSDQRWLTAEELGMEDIADKDFALGLHIPQNYYKVLDIRECFLQSALSNEILNFTRSFFRQKGISVYNTKTQTGFLRNLVIREGKKTNQLMVNIVTLDEDDELIGRYANELHQKFPEITTIVNNINKKRASVAQGDYEKIYLGDGFISDSIGSKTFRISANSFFQTNTLQAEKLYNKAVEYAGLKDDEVVYDLYSGAGTITSFLSGGNRKVFGFESSESAIKDALINAGLNNAGNLSFYNADLYKSFLPVVQSNNIPHPDLVITDPPRGGMHTNVIDDILKLSPERIVYVSCNPATQVRDIKLLGEAYKLVKICPVDMFPHTYHIENVALMSKR